jgi:hypothetical protein
MLTVEGIGRWGRYRFAMWTLDNQRICNGTSVLVGPKLEALHRVDGLLCPQEWCLCC